MKQAPVTLAAVLDDFERAEARAAALVAGRTNKQLNWQPEGHRWSVLQCLQHLALTNQVLGSLMERAVRDGRSSVPASDELTPSLLWRILLAAVERPGLKGFAPTILQPPSELDAQNTLAELARTHDQLRTLAGRCAGLDLNRMKFHHPFLYLNISVATTFLLITTHERRHLWQAERVEQACTARMAIASGSWGST